MAEKNEAVEAEKATKKAAAPKADAAKKPAAKKAPAKTSAADAKADGSAKAAPKKDAPASRPGVLKVHHLRPVPGSNTAKTRVGRGEGSKGKTAGRGTKGTKARNTVRVGFEGGQMPLHMRTPKLRGFKNPFRVEYQVVNLEKLAELYPQGGDVTVSDLVAKGAVRKNEKVKVLGNGDIAVKLTVAVDKVSGSAEQKIVAAGGSVK
ncbi:MULTISPECIES: 50S ribosomal protein L15 [Microbacterium]|uniref:50S ribosomal protein L15 n=1 Tax=Microbacterium TaxID=33882 RepID=UPI0021A9194D|nr:MULTISPECIES: 50S ribosomal protein L15 [Microbacterium]MCT1365554.1 50S ribosomal protein L15 [Microbacterium sp. p3-SID131]MCT1378162.1 50S ribosomal protein L15 [Microbacterium sp. p3-SID337]MCZ0709326.1 50S ribosomal protein L15 [Microbacterium paraoxydans]MDH5132128.1 50S ribosomal protein L15 [Microbacterium sp. RD10]MDH5135925.1 50S ribosomal protein L15 [Microbacterium sp. RD11]